MARSRYADTEIVDGRYYGTYDFPTRAGGLIDIDILTGVRTFVYTFSLGERLDHLAAKFWGDGSLWWVIALVNGIDYPFSSGGLTPGRDLKIPIDVNDILDKLRKG